MVMFWGCWCRICETAFCIVRSRLLEQNNVVVHPFFIIVLVGSCQSHGPSDESDVCYCTIVNWELVSLFIDSFVCEQIMRTK